MKFLETFREELEQEAVRTRRMLERIPDNKYEWRPHERSMTVKKLANHLAELPGWMTFVLEMDELDFAKTPYEEHEHENTAGLLNFFEESLQQGRDVLANATDAQLEEPWVMRDGETIYMECPRRVMLRETMNQTVHHRAQLGVYLRLLDVKIPGTYGPSADEMEAVQD